MPTFHFLVVSSICIAYLNSGCMTHLSCHVTNTAFSDFASLTHKNPKTCKII